MFNGLLLSFEHCGCWVILLDKQLVVLELQKNVEKRDQSSSIQQTVSIHIIVYVDIYIRYLGEICIYS